MTGSWWSRWRFHLLIGAGLLVLPALVLLREVAAARGCVERGGSYDYLRALCFMSGTGAEASGIPGPLLWIGLFAGAKLTALLALSLFRARVLDLARRTLVLADLLHRWRTRRV